MRTLSSAGNRRRDWARLEGMRRIVRRSAATVAVVGAFALGALGILYAVTPGEHSVALSGVDPIDAEPTETPTPAAPTEFTPTPTAAPGEPDAPAPAPADDPAPQPVAPAPVAPGPEPAAPTPAAPAPVAPSTPVEVTPEAPHVVRGWQNDDPSSGGDGWRGDWRDSDGGGKQWDGEHPQRDGDRHDDGDHRGH